MVDAVLYRERAPGEAVSPGSAIIRDGCTVFLRTSFHSFPLCISSNDMRTVQT
jgi:hypothetical protein